MIVTVTIYTLGSELLYLMILVSEKSVESSFWKDPYDLQVLGRFDPETLMSECRHLSDLYSANAL